MGSKVLLISFVLLSLIASSPDAMAATKPSSIKFTGTLIVGAAPLTVQFTAKSYSGIPESWDVAFGDGTSYVVAANLKIFTISHVYNQPGKYRVTFAVVNQGGNVSVLKDNYITARVLVVKPVASFYSTWIDRELNGTDIFDSVAGPSDPISFTDTSTGNPTSWLWDFGDGSTSTVQNPIHAYKKIGGYTVTLTVKNSIGVSKKTKIGYAIVLAGWNPDGIVKIGDFSAKPVSGKHPLTVLFTDLHPNVDHNVYSRYWDFGDGTVTNVVVPSYPEAPTTVYHTFNKSGEYTVTLVQFNGGAEEALTKYNCIEVK